MQQSMHYSFVQSQKPAITGRSNGQHWDQTTSTVDGDTKQLSLASGSRSCSTCVPTHVQKLSTLNLDFKADYDKKFIFHVERKTVGKSVKQLKWPKLNMCAMLTTYLAL